MLIITDPTRFNSIIERLETKLLSPYSKVNPLNPFPWLNAIPPGKPSDWHMIIYKISPAIFQETLYQLFNHKVPGLDNTPELLLKHIPQEFHKAIYQLFQLMAATITTPPHWLLSKNILLYKKKRSSQSRQLPSYITSKCAIQTLGNVPNHTSHGLRRSAQNS